MCPAALPENTVFRLLRCKHVILSDGLAAINWHQAMARARERIWSPGGVKVQHMSLQCIDLRRLSSRSPVLTRAWPSGRVSEEWAGLLIVGPSDHGRPCGDRSSSVLGPRCTRLQDGFPLKETSGEASSRDVGSRRAASARDSDAPSSVSKTVQRSFFGTRKQVECFGREIVFSSLHQSPPSLHSSAEMIELAAEEIAMSPSGRGRPSRELPASLDTSTWLVS